MHNKTIIDKLIVLSINTKNQVDVLMISKQIITIAAVIYAVFFIWYTNLSGPMSDEEIDQAITGLQANGLAENALESWKRFMRTDTGDQFIMLNNIDMNPSPPKMPDTPEGASALELMDVYMEHMYSEQFKRACHPVFFGEVVHETMDVTGIENATSWTHGALFRYRSRGDLVQIALNPASREKHDYKIAALTKTIAYPIEPTIYLSDPRFLLFLVLLSGVSLIIALRK